MDLRTYLFINKIKIAKLARDLSYSYSHIYWIVNSQKPASRRLAELLSDYTNGDVSLDEIYQKYPPKKE